MKNYQIAAIFIAILLAVGCSSGKSRAKTAGDDSTAVAAQQRKIEKLKLPDIPVSIISPDERAAFLVVHYWDNFDFGDTVMISHPEITEQAFVDYIDLFYHVPYEVTDGAVKEMLGKAMESDSVMFAYFTGMYEKYLHDPNSPMMNEEFYIPALEYIISSDKVDELFKIRPQSQLELALKNRVGHTVENFTYTLASGKTGRLYDIGSEYTLLMFYNPDCETCKSTKREIENSAAINEMLPGMTILAVYVDPDLDLWRNNLSDMPDNWIKAYDAGETIRKQRLYDLKAIPTLYLLDRNKKVLLKDAPAGTVIQYLEERAER